MDDVISVSDRMDLIVALATMLLISCSRHRPEVASFNAEWKLFRGDYYGR